MQPRPNSTFWRHQPVDFQQPGLPEGQIHELKSQLEPVPLPEAFGWETVDLHNQEQMDQVVNFLQKNYVEDQDLKFRLEYSQNFLTWYASYPGTPSDLTLVLVHKGLKAIVGLISGSVRDAVLGSQQSQLTEVNFLCLNPKLRQKGYAQKLIQELTRRSVNHGIQVATYTGARDLFPPLGQTQYYHRAFQYRRLAELGFCEMDETVEEMDKVHQVLHEAHPRVVPMQEKHLPQAYQRLTEYLERYTLHPTMSEEQFRHLFLPENEALRVVQSFVILKEDDLETVEDMISFYSLDSQVLDHPGEKIKGMYLYYYSALENDLFWMFHQMIALVKDHEYDVCNLTDIMENQVLVENGLFLPGTGVLKYYLYNWRLENLMSRQIGWVAV